MFKILKNILFIGSFIIFFTTITFFYFSDENVKKINKSRIFLLNGTKNNLELPVLYNDTNNIIVYTDEVEIYKKKKKI